MGYMIKMIKSVCFPRLIMLVWRRAGVAERSGQQVVWKRPAGRLPFWVRVLKRATAWFVSLMW